MSPATGEQWRDALAAAQLLALDAAGLGGALVRAPAGAVRDRWLALVRALLPPQAPWRRVPIHIADDRLLGGLDLAATLASGRPAFARGLLAEADGGIVVLPMAERMSAASAARIAAVLDAHELLLERDGLAQRLPARFGVIALDESEGDDATAPRVLGERLALMLDLSALPPAATTAIAPLDLAPARALLPQVQVPDALLQSLCAAAVALGVESLRVPLLALRVTRALAALAGRQRATGDDAVLAARLVLAARAVQLPAASPPTADEPPPAPDPPEADRDRADEDPRSTEQPDDMVVAAALAAIAPDLLLRLQARRSRGRAGEQGRAGAARATTQRGRPIGTLRGTPRAGLRLNLIETLRAAAPWQPLRRRERGAAGQAVRVQVRRDDFRLVRRKQPATTTTIFVVDASGSSALHRLAEAKGAVELLLAQCYVRRDRVALIAFRGHGAQLLLPPTRSLTRAKRALAQLPGGGGTPLAAGIDAACQLADSLRRRGETIALVLMTDGRANIARDGTPHRPQAEADARAAALRLRAAGASVVLVDTSPRPHENARALAAAMEARYLPLPHADAQRLSRALAAARD